MRHKIDIDNRQKQVPVTAAHRKLVRQAVKEALAFEQFDRPAEVSVSFVDDDEIALLNKTHRGIDRPTDVLSFPLFDEDFEDGEAAALGDIVISLERAAAQAEAYGHSFERELAFLTVHSVLHLLGYDHEEGKAEESEMFDRQEKILARMGLNRPEQKEQKE